MSRDWVSEIIIYHECMHAMFTTNISIYWHIPHCHYSKVPNYTLNTGQCHLLAIEVHVSHCLPCDLLYIAQEGQIEMGSHGKHVWIIPWKVSLSIPGRWPWLNFDNILLFWQSTIRCNLTLYCQLWHWQVWLLVHLLFPFISLYDTYFGFTMR